MKYLLKILKNNVNIFKLFLKPQLISIYHLNFLIF